MKEALNLSKYLLASAVIHGAVGWGWLPDAPRWAGLSQTQVVQNPIQIATLDLRPSTAAKRVRPDFLAPGQAAKKSGRTLLAGMSQVPLSSVTETASHAPFSRHGVRLSDDGVAETYTSRLHAALQRHFHHLFSDMPVNGPVVFNLQLEIATDGTVTTAEVQPTGYVRGDYLQRMMVAVRELKTLPAPPEAKPFVVPVAFKP